MNIGAAQSSLLAGVFAKPYVPLESGAVEGFANELTRRAAQTPTLGGAKRTVNDKGLSKAITNAVGYVKDKFGDQAANTVMGMVLNRAGSGPLSEDEIGDGFVNALEFIDRSFGTEAGDQAIDHFNGELNQAINGYFQNGKEESFLALDMDSASASLGNATGSAVSAVMDKFQASVADPAATLMDQAKSDLDENLENAGRGAELPMDENGMPITGDGSTTSSSDEVKTASADSKQATQAAKGKRRVRRLRRRRLDSKSGYNTSGLIPGMVLDKKI